MKPVTFAICCAISPSGFMLRKSSSDGARGETRNGQRRRLIARLRRGLRIRIFDRAVPATAPRAKDFVAKAEWVG